MKLLTPPYSQGFILFALFSCSVKEPKEKVDTYMNKLVAQKEIVGAAVGVRTQDRWDVLRGYGFSNIETRDSISANTPIHIMSITKNIVGVAVMQLNERSKLNIEEPVRKYLQYLPVKFDSILIYQLLNHSSGVTDYAEIPGFWEHSDEYRTPTEVIKDAIKLPLRFTPGSKFEYSNTNYYLLGLLIEETTSLKLSDYLVESIFKPANMPNTFLYDGELDSLNSAIGYSVSSSFQKAKRVNSSQLWAAGGIVTTLHDMCTWDTALRTDLLIRKETLSHMETPIEATGVHELEYGLGFELLKTSGVQAVGYTGNGMGFNSTYLRFLSHDASIIILTNTANSNSGLIAKNLFDIMFLNIDEENTLPLAEFTSDELDTLVMNVMTSTEPSNVDKNNFQDDQIYEAFLDGTLEYLKRQGAFRSLIRQAEKVNPETIVRRYRILFEKNEVTWVIIFSKKERKIKVANHQ